MQIQIETINNELNDAIEQGDVGSLTGIRERLLHLKSATQRSVAGFDWDTTINRIGQAIFQSPNSQDVNHNQTLHDVSLAFGRQERQHRMPHLRRRSA